MAIDSALIEVLLVYRRRRRAAPTERPRLDPAWFILAILPRAYLLPAFYWLAGAAVILSLLMRAPRRR